MESFLFISFFTDFITSTKEIMFYQAFVWQLYVKRTDRIFMKIYRRCICAQARSGSRLPLVYEFFEGIFKIAT